MPDWMVVVVTGLCLFSLIVLVRQRIRKVNTALAPGHVLILAIGPIQVLDLIGGVFRPFILAHDPSVYRAIDYGLCAIVLGLSLIYPIRTLRNLELRWRVCICLLVLAF